MQIRQQRVPGMIPIMCRWVWPFMVIAALVPGVAPATGYPDAALMATYSWLQGQQRSGTLQIIDVREPNQFALLHIPHAVNVPFSELRTPDNGPLTAADYARVFGDHGIHPGGVIVVYGDPGSFDVTYTLWALNYVGFDNARVYFGGIQDWIGHGGAAARGGGATAHGSFQFTQDPSVRETTGALVQALKTGSVVPVDARTSAEFNGTDIRALRGGHIPGAVNIDYTQVYRSGNPQTGRLKDQDALKKVFRNLDPNAHYVSYCQTGVRASMLYFTMRLMGFRHVALYPDSWQVWGSTSGLPTADTSYIDIPRITGAVSANAGRVDALESLVGNMVAKQDKGGGSASAVRPGLVYGAYIVAGLALLLGVAGLARRPGS